MFSLEMSHEPEHLVLQSTMECSSTPNVGMSGQVLLLPWVEDLRPVGTHQPTLHPPRF